MKDGLGTWRHRLFASDGFNPDDAPGTFLYSIPGRGIATGKNSRAIAAKLLKEFPELMQEAQGPSDSYAVWLRSLLVQHPGAVFEMEEPEHALVNGWRVKSPFFGQRPDDTFAVHFSKLLLDRRGSFSLGWLDTEWKETVTKRAAAYDAGQVSASRTRGPSEMACSSFGRKAARASVERSTAFSLANGLSCFMPSTRSHGKRPTEN